MAIRLHQVQIELTTPQHTLQSAWPENNLTTQATRSPPAPPLTLDKRPRPHSAFQLAPMSYCVPERVAAVLSYNLAIHQNSRLHCRLPACPPALKQTQTMLQPSWPRTALFSSSSLDVRLFSNLVPASPLEKEIHRSTSATESFSPRKCPAVCIAETSPLNGLTAAHHVDCKIARVVAVKPLLGTAVGSVLPNGALGSSSTVSPICRKKRRVHHGSDQTEPPPSPHKAIEQRPGRVTDAQ
ncbi:hypothetical protein IWZ01DRAFT_567906 [Phyllosticta capitalensis]